ncbi:MAG TPA: chromosome segregation protein SMC [Stellaceae bacterium]|jgi:chromosome segregation protein|nr:chromosome segregation protein SMC [Stellaceae bacterium]
MQVERLRLAGFKTFVDPTELTIGPGLTGIVGPNGCGKSNLVEALRWVMGEASARRLRGGEMDDVIFAGSTARPARNIAEVSLTLDNASRDAPHGLNDRDAVEVTRRLERRSGSAYRINGRETRARDVQLLFADAATGSHSGALIGQGRIGALIDAKPSERRLLLDDAAGTAGLHQRRHEAELKLKGAEENLLRLDDVIATMATQLEGLNKQAKQAQRYRRLAEQIRRAEAQVFDARWHAAQAESAGVEAALREAERAVAEATRQALAEERLREAAEAKVPPLRLADAAAGAAVQRLAHAREALEQELARAVAARAEAERRLTQIAADIVRESGHLADGDTALTRLSDERRGIEHAQRADDSTIKQAAALVEEAGAQLAIAETGLLQITEACATGEARRGALERERRDLAERRARLDSRLADGQRQRGALAAALVPAETMAERETEASAAVAEIDSCRDTVAQCAETLAALQAAEAEAVDASREAERGLARLKAESDALASLLAAAAPKAKTSAPPVLSQLEVKEGFEAAVAALCESELSAPILTEGSDAAAGWAELGPLAGAALPAGATPLAQEIGAPAALGRLLAQSGWVENEAAGRALQGALQPGQSLVDRDGHLWRWDGFTRRAAGPSATAQQLRHRNRLAVLAREVAAAETVSQGAAASAAAARTARQQAAAAEQAATAALRGAEQRRARADAATAELARRALEAETRLAAIDDAADKLAGDLREIAAQHAEAERSLAALPDPALARSGLEAARAQAGAARRREGEARTALDRLAQERSTRNRRLVAIAGEEEQWGKRHAGAAAQIAVLDERRAEIRREIAALATRPDEIARETETLAETSARAVAEHRAAGDALAVAETNLRAAGEAARKAETDAAERRERRARLDAQRDAATGMLAQLRAEIAERLGVAPDRLAELAEREPGAEAADPTAIVARLDRLLRERDAMGPVNLVAEREAAEVEERMTGLSRERAELTEAIARLRRGIGALDQEGRKRITAAFERLNEHFGELFGRLFGGGQASLAFDGDDPLEAGLEIMASPPGKRPQHLSLLSGGEQALTAIALIFAVFLTNPAPICVLDEVDAALDDANVDRFCRLVAETADATGTRFLLITHHRVTMARMDRLYGVTMPERGVSQLVSVDLARAAELRHAAE